MKRGNYITTQTLQACLVKKQRRTSTIYEELEKTLKERAKIMENMKNMRKLVQLWDDREPGQAAA